jgi:hypothetical protein
MGLIAASVPVITFLLMLAVGLALTPSELIEVPLMTRAVVVYRFWTNRTGVTVARPEPGS